MKADETQFTRAIGWVLAALVSVVTRPVLAVWDKLDDWGSGDE